MIITVIIRTYLWFLTEKIILNSINYYSTTITSFTVWDLNWSKNNPLKRVVL